MLLLLYAVVSCVCLLFCVDSLESTEAPAEVSARRGGVCLLAAEEQSGEKYNVKQIQRQETQYRRVKTDTAAESGAAAPAGVLTSSGEAKPRGRVRPSRRWVARLN